VRRAYDRAVAANELAVVLADAKSTAQSTAGLEEIVHHHNRATNGTILAAYEYGNIIGVRAR